MDSQQNFNQWTEDSWSAEPWRSELANSTLDSWPNYLWLDEDTNQASYDFNDKKVSDDFESSFSLPSPLSPTAFGLPSPISDYSQTEETSFEPSQFISPWDTSAPVTPLSNNINNTTPSTETLKLLAQAFPNSASTPGTPGSSSSSSSSYSPKSSISNPSSKKPTKATRKKSEKSAKLPIHKMQKAHNLIEKRYRNNLNEKIGALRDCIPSLKSVKKESDQDEDMECEDGESKPKCNKGVILGKAIAYIAELEKQVEKLTKENARLNFVIEGSLDSYLYASGQPCRGGLKARAMGRASA